MALLAESEGLNALFAAAAVLLIGAYQHLLQRAQRKQLEIAAKIGAKQGIKQEIQKVDVKVDQLHSQMNGIGTGEGIIGRLEKHEQWQATHESNDDARHKEVVSEIKDLKQIIGGV